MNKYNIKATVATFLFIAGLFFCSIMYIIVSEAEGTYNYFKWDILNQVYLVVLYIGLIVWLNEEYIQLTNNYD